MNCRLIQSQEEVLADIQSGSVVFCPNSKCRASDLGVMKPQVTFFGERTPGELPRQMLEDAGRCDLLLVVGSSLRVGGTVLPLLARVRPRVPQVRLSLSLCDCVCGVCVCVCVPDMYV